jgi:hypothetical protein
MSTPYIPNRDADLSNWMANFSSLITAGPATYGLTAPDAVTIAFQNSQFQAAYLLATNPATRTAPTVAAKDAARFAAVAIIRPYAIRIRNNGAVSDLAKVALGLTIPSTTPTPIPAPTTAPLLSIVNAIPLQQTLGYREPGSAGKAKPYGVIGVEIWRAVGTVPAIDPSQAEYYATATKSPFRATFTAPQVGKICTYFGRYVTRSGPGGIAQAGPFSAPLAVSVI